MFDLTVRNIKFGRLIVFRRGNIEFNYFNPTDVRFVVVLFCCVFVFIPNVYALPGAAFDYQTKVYLFVS